MVRMLEKSYFHTVSLINGRGLEIDVKDAS
jgi:hypothetical protein